MSQLGELFARTRAEGRAALIAYLPAGFPTVDGAVEALQAMVKAGVDAVEVGLAYSDPLMDGPTIQRAVETALANGVTTPDVISTAGAVAATGTPALVMSYYNPIERYGLERFASELAGVGGSGVITPDLTPEEAGPWLSAAGSAGLDPVFLVAPSSTEERLRIVTDVTGGFVYAASTMGVTGARTSVGERAEALVERVRKVTDLPVCVGLGVSTAEQAADVARFAEGVIVGSAFVDRILNQADWLTSVSELAADLAAGVRGGS